ncbi:MAG: T9SS type A sorting domain-containing protein [Candidatus Krumholzibacteriia bacterium]
MRAASCLLILLLGITVAAADDLRDLRAARRATVRAAALAKADGGAPFGLLVVPVDFADARFATAPDLAPRLAGDSPGALGHYVLAASQGRTRLQIVLAPLVSLPDDRIAYSDRDLQGFTRTRRLASEAIVGAVAAGVQLRAADADTDGEVDGVLILHAAPGLENDPDGFIMPLQYFLADPVVDAGTTARLYAVGAARSGLGLWAHETAHLLGLEDRYDVQLPAAGEAVPRGGLGRFSLMASGWLGSGEAADPALPDAYSRLQLGWVDVSGDLAVGVVRARGSLPPADGHYLLIERRDGLSEPPYDAGLGADRALVYRIREDYPEGVVDASDPARLQRVQLVEADGGLAVAQGASDGDIADLFPTDGLVQRLADTTTPSSRFFAGLDTGIDLEFAVVDGLATVGDRGDRPWARVSLIFPPAGESGEVAVVAHVGPTGTMPARVGLAIGVVGEAWGAFAPGDASVAVDLVPASDGGWANYAAESAPTWAADALVPPDAATTFSIEVTAGAVGTQVLVYPWRRDSAPLALDARWRERWTATDSSPTNTWQRWETVAAWTDPIAPVLFCAADEPGVTPLWPDILYRNSVSSVLASPPLGVDIRWVRLTHTLDTELLRPGVSIDAATLTWRGPSGTVPARPVDGWPGVCDPRAGHRLAGTDGFADGDSLREQVIPVWRTDVIPVPDAAVHGPGPWTLDLEFASNGAWRHRGWLVRDLAAGTDAPPPSAFPVRAAGRDLQWDPPAGSSPTAYAVEVRQGDQASWRTVAELPVDRSTLPLAQLGLPPGAVGLVRVLALAGHPIASRALVVGGTAGEAALAPARPNPARTSTLLAYDGGGDPLAQLAAYDLRGRRVRRWPVGAGAGLVRWDRTDGAGRRLPSGVYIVRLEADGRTRTTKVTWLH